MKNFIEINEEVYQNKKQALEHLKNKNFELAQICFMKNLILQTSACRAIPKILSENDEKITVPPLNNYTCDSFRTSMWGKLFDYADMENIPKLLGFKETFENIRDAYFRGNEQIYQKVNDFLILNDVDFDKLKRDMDIQNEIEGFRNID